MTRTSLAILFALLPVPAFAVSDQVPYDPGLAAQREQLVNLQADLRECMLSVAKAQLTMGNRSRNDIQVAMIFTCGPKYAIGLRLYRIQTTEDKIKDFLLSTATDALDYVAAGGQ